MYVIYIGSGDPTGTSRVPVVQEANFVNWYLHGACAGDISYLLVPFRDETWFQCVISRRYQPPG